MRTDPEIEAAFASFGTSTPPASANPASGRLIANVDALLDAPDLGPNRSPKAMIAAGTGTSSSAAHSAADALGIIREWQKVFTLTATRCTCCGTALRDSVSVSRGIGPDCSRQHYEIDFDITSAMFEEALGLLQASKLDRLGKIAAKGLKSKPRDLCNILIWWSSAHLDNTQVVLDCASIVTALGFVGLGDRLRERNTDVIISRDPTDANFYIVRCRSKAHVRRNMRNVKEATTVAREGRFTYGWRFPLIRKSLVWAILGEDFGGQWVTVPGMIAGNPSRVVKMDTATWYNVRDEFRAAYDPKPVASKAAPKATILRVRNNGQMDVIDLYTPRRNFKFVAELKALVPGRNRTWNRENGCWTVFSMSLQPRLVTLVAAHFNGAV